AIERAELSGGNGDDSFNVSGWFGQARLAGGTGRDALALGRGGNVILTDTVAYVDHSVVTTSGDVDVQSVDNSLIDALVIAASFSASVGGVAGVGASIGVSLARNFIGWNPNATTNYDYSTDDKPASITKGKRVRVARGARAGDIYEYVGSSPIVGPNEPNGNYLLTQDYGNRKLWKLVNFERESALVAAYSHDSSINATGALNISAKSTQKLESEVFAGAVAVAGGGAAGVGLSGAGANSENRVAIDVQAYVDGDGNSGITAHDVTITADDESTIDATVGSASLAASFGTAGVSVSVGVSLAHNEITNEVDAWLLQVDQLTTTTGVGDVSVTATEKAKIDATSVAASAAIGGGFVGVGFATAGADAYNEMDTKTNALVDASALTVGRDLLVKALNTSTIDALVAGVAAGIGGGAVGVGVAIGSSTAENRIGWNGTGAPLSEVRARVTNSNVKTTGDLNVIASNQATIDAEVDAVSVAIGAGGFAGAVSGAGTNATNQIAVVVTAELSSTTGTGIQVGDDANIKASDSSQITAESKAVSVAAAFGVTGAAVSIGVGLGENTIANRISATIDHANITVGDDLLVLAEDLATISSYSAAAAASGSLGLSLSGGGANSLATVKSTIAALVDHSTVNVVDTFDVKADADASIVAEVRTTSVSLGLIAAAASGSVTSATFAPTVTAALNNSTVVAGTLNVNADASNIGSTDSIGLSVSTGVSVGVSTSKIKSSGDVAATIGDGVTVNAKDVHIAAVTTESLLAKSQASSGALFVAGAGTVSEVDSSLGARSSLGADAKLTVKTFEIRATHDPDVDVKADAKTLGLVAGAGGSTDVSLTGDAAVGIGQRAVVNADAIIVGAVNKALKNRYANDSNLRSGSAGAASLSALSATTDIGSAGDRYGAIVTVGDQAQLLVGGNEANPGQLDISALSSVKAIDNVRIEGVGGYAMSLGEADDNAYTTSRIDL
ncbi:MAG TPA: hypothetical protein PLV92_12375, partial [Pirellulaceae bacterium]|nr:hypothetical protein [Pirellulaceae bacterium]